jgi:hypothetical protein
MQQNAGFCLQNFKKFSEAYIPGPHGEGPGYKLYNLPQTRRSCAQALRTCGSVVPDAKITP